VPTIQISSVLSLSITIPFSSRHRRIEFFFARAIATIAFWDLFLPRIGLRRLSQQTRSERLRRLAASYRAMANELGGLLIKVGLFLSARADVMPEEITSELGQLQDEVREENIQPFARSRSRVGWLARHPLRRVRTRAAGCRLARAGAPCATA
jgi:hypothetical protein